MSTFELTRPRKDINFSGAADPLNTTPAKVGQSYQNTTSGEIFHCTDDTGAVYTWIGTLGTQVLPLAAILATDHPNLVTMYTMDNIVGSTLVDETGANSGTIVGPSAVEGVIGNALEFSSSSHRVNTNYQFFSNTSDWTICLWLNSNLSGIQLVLNQYPDPVAATDGRTGLSVADTDIRFFLGSTLGNVLLLVPATGGVVYDFVVVSREGDTFSMSVNDGVPVTQTAARAHYNTSTVIGVQPDTGTWPYQFIGRLDQFRRFNRALTQEEITALYQEGL